MSGMITIKMAVGGNTKLDHHTYEAIKNAVRIITDDRRVASMVACPHEGITPEIVSHIRRKMIIRGELTARSYSRTVAERSNHG